MLNPFKKHLINKGFERQEKPVESIVKIHEYLIGGTQRRSARAVLICCPFHGENTPSCALYEDTSSYFCFSCNASGDYINFVEKTQNVGFKEALEIIRNI